MYVELKNINKTYGDYKASDNVSFGIEKGKLIGLLGPSGSGKTTILRMIAGLEQPDSGEIIIDGRVVNDVPASERGIGFVFQNYALFRYMTVYDNIAFGLKVQKADKKYIRQRVMELVELIGLKGLEKRYPSQLSGGQRQRVAFARALAPNPQLLLLDEPFAAIDAKIRTELRSWLKDMIEKPSIEEAPSQFAALGRYVITPDIFGILEQTKPGKGGEIQLTDALRVMAHDGHVYAYNFTGKRYDTGNKLGYLKTTVEFALRREDLGEDFKNYLKTLVANMD